MAATPELHDPGSKVMAAVGIVGAGLMGTACSKRLRQAGFEVTAYDVDAAKLATLTRLGARAAASIAAIAQACESIVICVFSTEQVEQVLEGAGGIAEAGDSKV